MIKNLSHAVHDSVNLKKTLLQKKYTDIINQIVREICVTLKKKKKIFICGNGGSASDAQHLSAEFVVRLNPKKNRKAYSLISLCGDPTNLTACGNDFGFKNIFKRNLEALYSKGDIVIILSTSGNSKNIIELLKFAKKNNIRSIAFLGKGGGICKKFSDIKLIVPSNNVARIQESHMFLGHFILNEAESILMTK